MHDTSSLTMLGDYPGLLGFPPYMAFIRYVQRQVCGFLAVLV